MKKTVFLSLLLCASAFMFGQSLQVQNMANAIRSKEYAKGKIAADAAAVHESTKGSAKMWMYRGRVYSAILSDTSEAVRKLDSEAEEKALEAYVNCLKLDAKDNIYKDEVKSLLANAAAAASNKANYYKINKQYDKAVYCYGLMESALPFDFDQEIKRRNITKEKIMYNMFEMYLASGNKDKTTEYASKLIDIKYKDPRV
jgi:tetratricopeptide (TPR) repeat protein